MNLTLIIIERFKHTEFEKDIIYNKRCPAKLRTLWEKTYIYDTEKLKFSPLQKLIVGLNLVVIGEYASFICEDRDHFNQVHLNGLIPEDYNLEEKLKDLNFTFRFNYYDFSVPQPSGVYHVAGPIGSRAGFSVAPMHKLTFTGLGVEIKTERDDQGTFKNWHYTGDIHIALLKVKASGKELRKYRDNNPLAYAEECLATCRFEQEKHVGIPNKAGTKFTFVKLGKKNENLLALKKRHPILHANNRCRVTRGEIKRLTKNRHCMSKVFKSFSHKTSHIDILSSAKILLFSKAFDSLRILTCAVTPKHNESGIRGKTKKELNKLLRLERI